MAGITVLEDRLFFGTVVLTCSTILPMSTGPKTLVDKDGNSDSGSDCRHFCE